MIFKKKNLHFLNFLMPPKDISRSEYQRILLDPKEREKLTFLDSSLEEFKEQLITDDTVEKSNNNNNFFEQHFPASHVKKLNHRGLATTSKSINDALNSIQKKHPPNTYSSKPEIVERRAATPQTNMNKTQDTYTFPQSLKKASFNENIVNGNPLTIPEMEFTPGKLIRLHSNFYDGSLPEFSSVAQASMKLKEFEMLAVSSKRINNIQREAKAHYICAYIYSFMKKHSECIYQLRQFLECCQSLRDVFGQALALNALAIELFENETDNHLEQCLSCCEQHRSIADPLGKYVAHINLGIVHHALGNKEKSFSHYKQALRYAFEEGNLEREAAACERLGVSVMLEGDTENAKAFFERHLRLAEEFNSAPLQLTAHLNLAAVHGKAGNVTESQYYYANALNIARTISDPDSKTVHLAKTGVALTSLQQNFDNTMMKIAMAYGKDS
eukprot:TRINITY_DN73_c0_g1_i1.p1 TRINITY_DN73_c0_g1~~TRINITY_DN73_c0_g1_i1.p1  ORF type:complete len:443 (+),score=126.33 TRINITY_DN73_c0_g1_i1:107-1435(+)